MQLKNFLTFILFTAVLFFGYMELKKRFLPQPNQTPTSSESSSTKLPPVKNQLLGVGMVVGPLATLPKPKPLPKPPVVTAAENLKVLGDQAAGSNFHIQARLDPRGATLRELTLVHFQATDDYGRPVWRDSDHNEAQPLVLVPDLAAQGQLSHQLFLYDPLAPADLRPQDTLGTELWEAGAVETLGEEGRKTMRVTFTKKVDPLGLEISKTYSLVEGDYHLGLDIRIKRVKQVPEKKEFSVRYQLTGAVGLPIEAKWYASIFRNALIADEDKDGNIYRDFQDQRSIATMGGGNEVRPQPKSILRYAGIAIQYFASVVVVDNIGDRSKEAFVERARPTLEAEVTRGVLKSVNAEEKSFVLVGPDGKEVTFYTFHQPEIALLTEVLEKVPGKRLAVASTTDSRGRQIVVPGPDGRDMIANEFAIQPNFEDDITVRLMSEPTKLAVGESLEHHYLLYNGPVKPNLLRGLPGVSDALVDRYVDTLHLNTLTDYPSNWFIKVIGWSWLVITTTNLVHWVLGHLYSVVHNYGICILLLTILVRLLMFPLSRKQAIVGIKMQLLAPELKKLQEKYKEDKTALAHAQWDLQRRHGVNPFGTCWVLLLQMPIFMGLYFALQESINFRLAPFWPTWIINLAAPDMLIRWGTSIPVISQPEWYGWPTFLGPFFNILPVIAVILMLIQQRMMTPPATDEQQQANQKVMTVMMLMMGLMFFKTASGLCLYYIASSLWGFAERQLLPRQKLGLVGVEPAALDRTPASSKPVLPRPNSTAITTSSSAPATGGDGITSKPRNKTGRNRKKEQRGKTDVATNKGNPPAEQPGSAAQVGGVRGWFRKRKQHLSEWWQKILQEAEKKNR